MKITIEDGAYSDNADPERGYHDYVCTVIFETCGLTDDEQIKIVKFFRQQKIENGHMWVYEASKVSRDLKLAVWEGAHVWTFHYGYDSGD